jgi:hypothetical protein
MRWSVTKAKVSETIAKVSEAKTKVTGVIARVTEAKGVEKMEPGW